MAIPHFSYSFKKAFLKLTVEQGREAKQRIEEYLGTTCRSDFSRRMNWYRDIPSHVYEEITLIFAAYGLAESDVWDKTEIEQ